MNSLNYEDLRFAIRGAQTNLESNKEYVNGLNVFPVPDGDTGTNMSLTMKSVINKLAESENTMESVAKALSNGSLMGARGNSGVILSQLCRGMATVFQQVDKIEIINLVEAFESAKETAYKAVLKPTEGTILTVSRKIAEFARAEYIKYDDIILFLSDSIRAGQRALDQTPEMLPVLKEAGVVDAGGQGLVLLLEGAYKALIGEEIVSDISTEDIENINLAKTISHHSDVKPEDIIYGYCTEFLIHHDGSQSYEDFKNEIMKYGDSIVSVGDDELIKTHIHTDDPGLILSLARKRGELSDIKIENMRFQNAEVNKLKEAREKEDHASLERKEYGFVAVSIGEGFNEIFNSLNVDKIIVGGQTMNPSTEDVVEAVNKVNADNVFIFPNNKNIILAAKQAVDLVDTNLIVVETKSIPESFAALINFNSESSLEDNIETMNDAIEDLTSLQLTFAVRDTKNGDLEIKKDDYIGLKDGNIIVKGEKLEDTLIDLIDKSLDEDAEIITLYYGEDINEEDSEDLYEKLEEKFSDLDIELNFGGQPLYYYIASIE